MTEMDRDRPDIEKLDLAVLSGWGINNYGYIGHLKRLKSLGNAQTMPLDEIETRLKQANDRRESLLKSVEALQGMVDFMQQEIETVEGRLKAYGSCDGLSEVAANVSSLDEGQDNAELQALRSQRAIYIVMLKLQRGDK